MPTVPAPDTVAVAGEAVVALVGVPDVVRVGETFEVEVVLSGVRDLYGAELHLSFDPSALQVVNERGDVAARVDAGGLLTVRFTAQNSVDHAEGRIDYAVSQMPPSKGVTGDGVLVRLQFRATGAGSATIALDDLLLASSIGEAIPWSAEAMTATVELR
jgi:hypothetical protein